jgi:hypothetical protein
MFCISHPLIYRCHGDWWVHKTNDMTKKQLKIALGLALLPLFTIIYFIDRAILVLFPWIEQKTIKKWFDDIPLMVYSFTRVLAGAVVWLVYELIFG